MPAPSFIAGDWGTSNLRLFLCEAGGRVCAQLSGPGAAAVKDGFDATFDALIAPWRGVHGVLPAVLSGMVGSTIGWTQVPYVACPVRPEEIAAGCGVLRGGTIRIVPGLSCQNPFGAPDVMRGEETQILGALHLEPMLGRGRHLLCLPGTHTKWVWLEDGVVTRFLTAPTGEVFAVLRDHSVLVGERAPPVTPESAAAFAAGLAEFNRVPAAQLLHRLFESRSRRLSGELAEPAAAPYLSGLLVASDVAGALATFDPTAVAGPVRLVGTPQLTTLYASALALHGRTTESLDGAAAALAGIIQVRQHLVSRAPAHAH